MKDKKKKLQRPGRMMGRRDGRIEVGAYPLNPMYTLLFHALSGEFLKDYGSFGMGMVGCHMYGQGKAPGDCCM